MTHMPSYVPSARAFGCWGRFLRWAVRLVRNLELKLLLEFLFLVGRLIRLGCRHLSCRLCGSRVISGFGRTVAARSNLCVWSVP